MTASSASVALEFSDDPAEARVLAAMNLGKRRAAGISTATGLPPGQVQRALNRLRLARAVVQTPEHGWQMVGGVEPPSPFNRAADKAVHNDHHRPEDFEC